MTYWQKSKKKINDLRKKQEELKKCIDKQYNEIVDQVLRERYDYQMRCHHEKMKEKKIPPGGGHRWCPKCGFEYWWGSYSCEPTEPPKPTPPPYSEDISNLLKKWELV